MLDIFEALWYRPYVNLIDILCLLTECYVSKQEFTIVLSKCARMRFGFGKEPMKKFNFYSKNIDLGWGAYKLGHMPGKNSTPPDVNFYVWENM